MPISRWGAGWAFCTQRCEIRYKRDFQRQRFKAVERLFRDSGRELAHGSLTEYVRNVELLDGLPMHTIRALIDYPEIGEVYGWPPFGDAYWADCQTPRDYLNRVREIAFEVAREELTPDPEVEAAIRESKDNRGYQEHRFQGRGHE